METKGISKLDLKRRNRKQILLAIRQAGMLARVDIAAQLSLTRAAVTIITNQMISQNILEDMNSPLPEPDDQPKKKGRKKTMIRINPTYKYAMGAVIDETGVSVGISNLANEVVGQIYREIDENAEQDEIISFIVTGCRSLLKKHNISNKQLLGLGVGVAPSRKEQFRGEMTDGYIRFKKLGYLLEMELSIPVLTACAVNLYALSNIDYSNAACGAQILIYSGNDYYSVIVHNNEMIGGGCSDPSSISRVVVTRNGAKSEGYPDGSVHAELSRPSLIAKCSEAKSRPLTMDEINDAYSAGDADIQPIIENVLSRLSFLIYNYCTLAGARKVTLQGFRLCEKAHEELIHQLNEMCGTAGNIQIAFSPIHGENAFLAGSALAVEKQFFELGGLLPGEAAN